MYFIANLKIIDFWYMIQKLETAAINFQNRK